MPLKHKTIKIGKIGKKEKTLSWWKKKTDKAFSDYIRQRDNGVCFTCGLRKEWKYQQCGHFISRTHNSTRFNEKNCHCQCVGCNIFKSGNMAEYAVRLQRKYGVDILEELIKEKQKTKQYTIQDYQRLSEEFKEFNKRI